MGRGLLEVHLVDAKGLAGTDFLGKIDPYVIVQYRSQERKSTTARDDGRNPIWNEVLKFQISSTAANVQHKLLLRIMDHDNFSSDDFLGQATINVTDLITIGMEKGKSELNPAKYSVVTADNSYHGAIKVGSHSPPQRLKRTEDKLEAGCTVIVIRRCHGENFLVTSSTFGSSTAF